MHQVINALMEMIIISLRGTYGEKRIVLKDCYNRLEGLLQIKDLRLEELQTTLDLMIERIKELDK